MIIVEKSCALTAEDLVMKTVLRKELEINFERALQTTLRLYSIVLS